MANQFESSYSCLSPLSFVEMKYDNQSKDVFVLMRGMALGNMTVKNKDTNANEILRTHQLYDLTFIKRQGTNKWKLFYEESRVHVLENNKQ